MSITESVTDKFRGWGFEGYVLFVYCVVLVSEIIVSVLYNGWWVDLLNEVSLYFAFAVIGYYVIGFIESRFREGKARKQLEAVKEELKRQEDELLEIMEEGESVNITFYSGNLIDFTVDTAGNDTAGTEEFKTKDAEDELQEDD